MAVRMKEMFEKRVIVYKFPKDSIAHERTPLSDSKSQGFMPHDAPVIS